MFETMKQNLKALISMNDFVAFQPLALWLPQQIPRQVMTFLSIVPITKISLGSASLQNAINSFSRQFTERLDDN